MYNLLVTAAVLLYARSEAVSAQLCPAGDFDSQLRHILHNYMWSAHDHADIISRVLHDVRPTLNKRWQGFKIFPFGSLSTGLGTIFSDVDINVRLRNYNSSAELQLLAEVEQLLKEQPAVYSNVRSKIKPKYSSFSFFHIPSQQKVDVVVRGGEAAAEQSKLLRYYFHLDKRSLALVSFLKIWFKIHTITGGWWLPNYAVYLLVLFYLQQKHMAPPVYMLQIDSVSHIIDNWDMGFNELPYRSTNTENLHQLLGGFFKYYSEFNFEEYIVSPFAGRPILKSAFVDIEYFPKEFTLYKNSLGHTLQLGNAKYLNISTDVCIQDLVIHDSNKGGTLNHEDATKFKHLITSVATMFHVLPSDSVLGAILKMDQHNATVISRNLCYSGWNQ